MPFQNMTNDIAKNFWQEMIQDNLIASLSNSEEIKVRQTESIITLLQNTNITNYASVTPSIARSVSQKLDANVFVHGSINQTGTIIRLNARLINSETEEIIKSFQKDGTEENILGLIDTLSSMVKDYLVISKLKSGGYPDFEPFISTNSPEAYKFFLYGENERRMWNNEFAAKYYSQAIDLDSNFAYAVVMLSYSYINLGIYDQPKSLCMKVYNKRGMRNSRERIWLDILHAYLFETPFERITYLRQLQRIDNQNPLVNFQLGFAYYSLSQNVNAIHEYEKALKIYKDWGSKPYWVNNYTNLGQCYHLAGQFSKERQLYKKAEKDFPDKGGLTYRQAILALSEGKSKDANEYVEKYKTVLKENSASEATIATNLASIYSEAGILDNAEEYYRQVHLLEPENPEMMNQLAYFLIDRDRNINEGLELVGKALVLSPENYEYLDTKGLGLYKQGKYQEAKEILQRSWDLRMKNAIYDHEAFLHLEEAQKAVANQKNN
jgi:Tfp pilus assembly protein PilF/TolB-like protein